ncbi:epoxide hydrolase family protein [Symbioplanes lichenis]|uniref:epoxide hydrolase family protein n=1 Tax=Symbioplanes lichenis TaxID=1629072 RepID=UPI00273A0BA4|nr:epoxide hydrolase family protein [Actinoplanes lichenis]
MSTSREHLIDVPEAELEDLRARLRATRWAKPWLPAAEPGATGVDGDELRRLAGYWADGYDWRKHESTINALPSHFAEIDGTTVHYLRYDAERPGRLPLLLANGWPSSFLELTGLAERLSAPSEWGGDPDDAFTVIVPALPGYGVAPQRPASGPHTHELWHRLMTGELGFARYGAHGSDIGAGDVSRLGEAYPPVVAGLHLLDTAAPEAYDQESLTPEERAYLAAEEAWAVDERGYSHEQQTRPLTLAQGLSDSPSGLLAWILEKYRVWSATRFTDDFVLTQASLYWFTNSISTSFRPYYERHHNLVPAVTRVDVPTAVALFPSDLGARKPRSWIERNYRVARYTLMPRGGHFAAYEEPDLLAADLRAFFRTLA